MSGYPIEKQLCTPRHAQELARILGKDAPGSVWYWKYGNYGGLREKWRINDRWTYPFSVKGKHVHDCATYPAYTGDELGALLPTYACIDSKRCYLNAWKSEKGWYFAYFATIDDSRVTRAFSSKAALAIEGLTKGWIKKEEFTYEK